MSIEHEKSNASLKRRTAVAGGWVAFGHIALQVIRLGGNLVLTRLLVPEMFGVMAVVQLMLSAFVMFSDIGLQTNIIQSKRGEEPLFLNTAWTIQILRGGVVFLFALIVSVLIFYLGEAGLLAEETAYSHPALPYLLAVTAITSLVSGFNSIHLPLLSRKLQMSKVIRLEIVSAIAGLVVMVFLAWQTSSIWALAIGAIITSLVKMILSHQLNKKEAFRLCWDRSSVREIIGFGKWVFLSSILGYLFVNGDRLLLGGVVSAYVLGIYTIAFTLANAVKELLTRIIVSVFFPTLSEAVRESPEKLKNIYYNIKIKVDSIVMLSIGFLYSTSEDLIRVLYDDRYESAGLMLKILSLSLVNTGFTLANQCFLAHGKSKVVTGMTLVQVVSFYSLFPIMFSQFGLEGALWALVMASIIQVIVSCVLMKKHFFLDLRKELLPLPFALVGFGVGSLFTHLVLRHIA